MKVKLAGAVFACALALTVLAGPLCTSVDAAAASVVTNGRRDLPKIALTFDDNFNTERSLKTIKALRDRQAEATFFVVGWYVDSCPAITQAIADGVAAGLFEVGDHSLSHPMESGLSWSALVREIGAGTDAFRVAAGVRTVPLHRPPYGNWNSNVAQAAGAEGFSYMVLWDVDTNDWRGHPASQLVDHVLKNARNGSIVLMHVGAPHTYAAIPGIVEGLRARGFELVTVSELLKGKRLFLDVSTSMPGSLAVVDIVGAGLMSGYDQNYFGPDDPMTRAQFAKVAVLACGLHSEGIENLESPSFVDVRLRQQDGVPVAYPFDYIEEAAAAGIVMGKVTEQGLVFMPQDAINRVQLAIMLARMAREIKGIAADSVAQVAASSDVPDYARADVAFVQSLGLMQGYSDGTFRPYQPAKRIHVAVVVSRFLGL